MYEKAFKKLEELVIREQYRKKTLYVVMYLLMAKLLNQKIAKQGLEERFMDQGEMMLMRDPMDKKKM
jgi:hypothetical protein